MADQPPSPSAAASPQAASLSIGALARATGVAVATLRMWESRYDFPQAAHRTEAGHRRYDPAQVAQVLDVAHRRDGGMRLGAAIEATRAATVDTVSSVYATLVRDHHEQPRQRLRKSTLVGLSRACEDELASSAAFGQLFGAFQTVGNFEAARARWGELARTAPSTFAFADFSSTTAAGPDRIERVHLAADAPMRREWAVVNDSPHLPLALTAWELPGQQHLEDRDRLFESVWTLDPHAVRSAARSCAALAAASGSVRAQEVLDGPLAGPPPPPPALLVATRLTHRMVAYVEAVGSR